jgi:hypothetical protein
LAHPADTSSDAGDDWRRRLVQGEVGVDALCAELGLTLATDRLHYFAHWITPQPSPRRYDTRFFLAEAPAGQQARHDEHEAVDHEWVAPADALARFGDGDIDLILPTLRCLEALAPYPDVAALLDAVQLAGGELVADHGGSMLALEGVHA